MKTITCDVCGMVLDSKTPLQAGSACWGSEKGAELKAKLVNYHQVAASAL